MKKKSYLSIHEAVENCNRESLWKYSVWRTHEKMEEETNQSQLVLHTETIQSGNETLNDGQG
jgi:hypothetical protein